MFNTPSRAAARIQTICNHLDSSTPYPLVASNESLALSSSYTAAAMSSPVRVLITGAAGQIAYSLLPMICSGRMFGPSQTVILHLLDIAPAEKVLKGVVMELDDSAYPLLKGVVATTDVKEAFTGIDVAILLGAFPRKAGMERKDLLQMNGRIFKEQGHALENYASPNVKVVVVGNPANTNCLILRHNAPSIPSENFSALTRLDHNRARAQIALKLGVSVENVHNVLIWGNHSSTQYPDVNHAYVAKDGLGITRTPVRKAVNDDAYLNNEFVSTVQKRGAAVIEARGFSSAASAAKAITDHMHDWLVGTPEGEYVSMAVMSEGSYGVPSGLIYSFPVTCKNGTYKIVQGLEIDEFSRKMMDATAQELSEEKEAAFSL